ncbi:MAG: sodium:proton exchanger, partial [Coriobacteriaceae bacterium]|nr:sodium:proton exchanger [Coriobacteriaceae bacterium]
MGHDTDLLMSIVMAVVAAFVGGLIARRFRLPTIVGYLVGGVVVGPFTPGYAGDSDYLQQLAEIGVMFMMFGVGLHFSLKDLWNVRKIALPGAIFQILLGTLFGYLLGQLWGWSTSASIVLGIAISIASTVVLIRNLTNEGLFNTPGGQVATGWLIVEDVITIIILVILPVVFGSSALGVGGLIGDVGIALLKTATFTVIMIFLGSKVMPWLLTRIARFQSSELFLLAVIVLALGTAVGAAELFGVSIALGAFLAGVVIKGSGVSNQVAAKAIPFQDLFSIIFFVSVGMMVNPMMLIQNFPQVIVLTLLIIVGKWFINFILGLLLPASAHTSLTVAAGLSQIGEFSFLVCQTALLLGALSTDQYSLILAGSAISIALNPMVFKTITPIENWMKTKPFLWDLTHRHKEKLTIEPSGYNNHVVIVGFGKSGRYTARILK